MTTKEQASHPVSKPPTPDCIRIAVNGEERRLPAGTALSAFLAESNVPVRFIAVAVNREVIRRDDQQHVVLRDGDVVEIVRMVGGGDGDCRAKPSFTANRTRSPGITESTPTQNLNREERPFDA